MGLPTCGGSRRQAGGRQWHVLLAALAAMLAGLAAIGSLAVATGISRAADGVQFEKYWDDAGYEDMRPESVTFHLYREDAPETEVASTTLTAADAVLLEPDHWHGMFEGVPVDDGNGDPIAYVVKEDVPENYIASYDYGYDGYEVTFTSDSWVYSTFSLYLGYKDEAGDWWSAQIYEWSGGRIPVTDDEVAIGGSYAIAPSNRSPYTQKNSDYISDEFMTKPGRLPRHDIKYLQKVYGNDYSRIRTMANWPVGYSEAWEYKANLGRHTPVMRINEDSVSWGLGNTHDWDRDGIHFQIESITPTRGNRGIEITDTINLRDFPVTKKWDDEGMEAYRPGSVTVDVYQDDGTEPYATKVIRSTDATDGNTWEATFESLPKYFDDGSYREHEYTLVERPVEGYSTEYDSEWYNGLEFEFGDDTMIGFNDFRSFRSPTKTVWQKENHRGPSWFIRSGETREGTQTVVSAATGLRYSLIGSDFMFYRLSAGTETWTTAVDYSPGFSVNNVRRVHIDREYVDWSGYDSGTMIQLFNGTHPTKTLVNIAEGMFYPVSKEEAEAENKCYYYKWDYSRPFAGADTITNRTMRSDIPFEKYWDDEGYEDMRPSSVKFRLYRESEPDTEVASVTLTADDAVAGEDDHWHGEFGGIPMRDGEDAGAFVVKEDVPEGYIASYDYGYDGYNITFSDDTYLARGYGLRFAMQDADGKWRSDYLYEVTGEGISDSDYNYPARGPYEVSLSTLDTGDDTSNMEWALATLPDCYDIKYVTELCGDEYPRTPDEYECGYSQIWRYQGNLGKNMPVLWLVMDSVSYGWQGGPPRGYKFEVIDMEPVRNGPPRNEITNTVNKESLPFKKVWDDEGHESHRPSQVTVDLYQDGGTAPYATKTLRASSYPSDASVWEASFDNLPKYGDGYAEHEYVLRERPVAGYDTTYDSEYYNAIDVTFTGDTTAGANTLYAIGSEGDILDVRHYGPGWFTSCLAGRTFSFPGKEVFMGGSHGTIGISDVRRVHVPELSKNIQQVNDNWLRAIYDLSRGAATTYYYQYWDIPAGVDTGGQVPEGLYDAGYVHYKWDDTQPFVGADTIINTTRYADIDFRKIWEDGDDTGNRPSSTTFDLLGADGRVEKTVTLTAADADSDDTHVWRGSFGERLSTQPYSIRERPISGYKTVYDSDDPRADVTVLTFEVNDEGLGSGADLHSEVRGEAVRTIFPNDSPTLPIYWDIHKAARNDDGTVSVRLLGSRVVSYMPNVSHFELKSVARTGHTDMVMPYGNPVSYSLQTRLDGIGESYGLIYTDGETLDSYDGQARPTYFLYEQTVPFTYCNIIRNIPARSIPIMKLCDKSGPAVGAKMGAFLQNDDGTETLAYQWVTEYENGQNPYHPVPLATGSYVIRELEAPHGYGYADEEHIRVDVCNRFYREMDGTEHLWMNNAIGDTGARDIMMTDKATGVSIYKKGPDGDLLAGATLQVVASDGTVIHEFTSSSEQPEVLIAMLDAGKEYVLREKAVPDDSLAYARDVRFTVPKTGATADEPMSVEMVDEKVAVRISKKSVTGEDEIAGATLTLAEKGGGLVERWVSDGTAREFGDDKVTTGKTYVLHEEGAPDGYAYAADIEFVAGMAGSPDVVVMRDKPTHVEISKVAVTGGDELPGATLCVFDAAGDVVDKWVSGESPHVIEGILIAGGTYVLHEEAAPEGHEYAADIEFRVSEDGSVDRVEMVDEVSPAPVDQQQPGSDGEEGVGGTLEQPGEEAADAAAAGGQGAAGPTGGTSTSSKSPLMQTGEAVAAGALAVLAMSATALGVIRKTREARRA